MDSIPGRTFLPLLILFSLLFLSHARLNLHRPDFEALKTIQCDLGVINGPNHSPTPSCNTPGVFCEWRIVNNSNVLRITRLVIKSQRLNGFLSPSIGRLTELKELSLPNNRLVDQLPHQVVDCKKLEILNLRNNKFSGGIPAKLSNLASLKILDISSNKFSGNLSFLKYFPNLEKLSVANNQFSGKIPNSIRSFRNLRFFNFSGNSNLQGPIPKLKQIENWESQFPKRYILVENSTSSTNSTSAAAAPASSQDSNSDSESGSSPSPSPSSYSPKKNHKSTKKKVRGWILGFIAGAVGGSLSGLVFSVLLKLLLAWISGSGKESGPSIFSPLIKKAEDLAFLERDGGLASLEEIGRGGCGEVYKAELPGSNGKLIAIKRIVQPPKDAAELTEEDSNLLSKKMRQIRSEIKTVGEIRHRNLLPLLAHVSRPDCHYLIYEFMKNGSLQDILNDAAAGRRELDWMARAIDPKLLGSGYEEQMLLVLKVACFCTLDDPKQRPNSKDVRCMLAQLKD
ncbi:Leucine-rich repeat [Dillenia turbinata]|uniref:Leucine-rich repeat n=1 Tax=Dillenia turbinata TaxID=194707 RepID=A0AAN8V103_9MAGN